LKILDTTNWQKLSFCDATTYTNYSTNRHLRLNTRAHADIAPLYKYWLPHQLLDPKLQFLFLTKNLFQIKILLNKKFNPKTQVKNTKKRVFFDHNMPLVHNQISNKIHYKKINLTIRNFKTINNLLCKIKKQSIKNKNKINTLSNQDRQTFNIHPFFENFEYQLKQSS